MPESYFHDCLLKECTVDLFEDRVLNVSLSLALDVAKLARACECLLVIGIAAVELPVG